MGHENAEGMAHVGVRVEPTVRLGHGVEGFHSTADCGFFENAFHLPICLVI